jgi:hypothetical protein
VDDCVGMLMQRLRKAMKADRGWNAVGPAVGRLPEEATAWNVAKDRAHGAALASGDFEGL